MKSEEKKSWQEQKESFVKQVGELLKSTRTFSHIDGIEYERIGGTYPSYEIAHVIIDGCPIMQIDITGDSEYAILKDIIKGVEKYA